MGARYSENRREWFAAMVGVHNDQVRRRQWSVDYTQDVMGNIISSTRNPDGSAGNSEQETTVLAIHVRDEIRSASACVPR